MGPLTRRQAFAAGAAGIAGAGLLGAAAAGNLHDDARRFRDWIERRPDPFVPNAPEGRWSVETVHSAARGRDVDLFTAVPHGYGTGAGLPVCLILHGATARPLDFEPFGLPRFLTAAVTRGAPPFVLMGADGGLLYWEPDPDGGDDPERMVLEELPRWAEERGFDTGRLAAWGWSMGGLACSTSPRPGPVSCAVRRRSALRSRPATTSSMRSGSSPGRRSASGAGATTRSTRTCAGWSRRSPSRRVSSPMRPARTPASTGTA